MEICIKNGGPVKMKKTAESIIKNLAHRAIPISDNDDVLVLDGNTWQSSDLETMLIAMRPKFVIFDDIRTPADKKAAQNAARAYRNDRANPSVAEANQLTAIYVLHYTE